MDGRRMETERTGRGTPKLCSCSGGEIATCVWMGQRKARQGKARQGKAKEEKGRKKGRETR